MERENLTKRELVFNGGVFLKESLFLAQEALGFLNARNQKIVSLFFGLEEKKTSLAGIGKKMGITRERARQIKVESLKKIKKAVKKSQDERWVAFFEKVEELFLSEGGFIEEHQLGVLFKKDISQSEQGKLNFLLSLADERFSFEKKNETLKNFWLLKKGKKEQLTSRKEIAQALDFLRDYFKEEKRPVRKIEIKKQLASFSSDFFASVLAEKRLENLLFLGAKFGKNILGQWGLLAWPVIASSITKERAFLVLKKENQPLHFRKIAELIKEYWPKKKIILQTVHNELIKDARFALVGRGVYGLCEWGFVKSPVKKIVLDFLKKENRPLEKKEILEYIMKMKQVKNSTVSVCLSDRNYFQKTAEGKFLAKV